MDKLLSMVRNHHKGDDAGTIETMRAMYGFMGIALSSFTSWHFLNDGQWSIQVFVMAALGAIGILVLVIYTKLIRERCK